MPAGAARRWHPHCSPQAAVATRRQHGFSMIEGLIAAALIGMAGLLTFTDTSPVVTIVLVFLLLDTLKGYILYPLLMGKQFTMNAVMLFVALTFWWWAWGIPGALLAVPLMAILKIFSERMDGLAPLAKLLEE